MTTPAPHKYAALIKQWADDPSQRIWYWQPIEKKWFETDASGWDSDYDCALGEKPTSPPRRMCVLAGIEFSAPETEEPKPGTQYWKTEADGLCTKNFWKGDWMDRGALAAGLIHLDAKAAISHSCALLAANKAAVGL